MKGTTFIDFTEFLFPDSAREIWMVYSYCSIGPRNALFSSEGSMDCFRGGFLIVVQNQIFSDLNRIGCSPFAEVIGNNP